MGLIILKSFAAIFVIVATVFRRNSVVVCLVGFVRDVTLATL